MVCQLAGLSQAASKLAHRMQVLKDNLIYSLGVDGVLEDDRQILVEEQKSCRALARKHSLETNRRRKALEERRKLWDVQEERLRENILQQRKQRVQDATERFQRAHLPPSQRRRQSIKKSYPNIEDALRHIQGTFSSYARQSSFLSSSSTISRSCTPSPKPPMGPNLNRHQRTLSAVEAYTKLMQEQTMHSFKNSQLLFLSELQETQVREQEATSPQDDHVPESHHSDSLSSLDSLENEDFNHNNSRNIACSSQSSLDQLKMFDCKKKIITQRNINDNTPTSTNASSSDNLLQTTQLFSSPQCKSWQQEPEEPNKKLQNLPETTRGATTTEKSLNTEAQPSNHHHSFLALIGTDTGGQKSEENARNKIALRTQITASPDSTPLDFACLLQNGKLLDNRLHVTNIDDKSLLSKNPSATKVNLPTRNYNHKEDLCEAHEVMKETIAFQTTLDSINQSHKSYDVMNNLDNISDSEPNADRTKHTEPINQTCNSNTNEPSDIPKCHAISGTSFQMGDVRDIKGILKKQSKYVSGDAKTIYGAGHLVFTKQVALSIRDSVELTKMKAKEEEGNKKMKKKLRWLDEVNNEGEDKEINTNVAKQNHTKSKYANPLLHKSYSADHQESMTVVPGAPRTGPNTTPSASTSYQFTKQAWADVEVQGGKLQDQEEEVKVQRGSIRNGCPRVPRRVRSARVGSGSVSSCSRKGTVIRPQSAAELNHIARSQGKVMVPRPPPRTDTMDGITGEAAGYSTSTLYYLDHTNAQQGLPMEQALYRENSDCLNPSITDGFRTDSGVMFTPFPPSYHPSSESASKGSTTSGQQESQASGGRRGGAMLYDEKGLCLDRTPTDEEISQLWHGVRSALSTNNARANLTQVTINGDSLINGVRAVTRMGGFFLSPSNARNVIRRPNPESTRSRRRCVEPSRQAPGLGNRRLPIPTQATYQLSPWPCKYDLTHTDEGLESAAQSSLAELPGETSVANTDVMAAMETIQTQKQQQRSLTNISLEEQKILLSLDRLNNRLQYVQEYAGGNTAAKGILHDVMAYGGEGKASNPNKHRIVSADSRFRSQKKF
ncbi:centrosomal protein of 126 kDa [Osmerus mordax]|uniref:centrosomal protein of 126 kDa n=1 Tax=Osmerus mordax TaxID=8014 RepID=UPI00350FD96E